MAIVSRQEYADMCGEDVKVINVNVSRKKITSLPDKRIDTENPLNKIYYKAAKKKAAAKLTEQKEEKKKVKQIPIPDKETLINQIADDYKDVVEIHTPKETPTQRKAREAQNEDDADNINWDKRKKIADALKAERAAELAQLQVEKMMGSLMPVDMVERILVVNIQDIIKNFENELINLGSIYCDILAGGNREKLAELITKLRTKLSDIVQRTQTTAAQEVANVVEEYADVRNRGERK